MPNPGFRIMTGIKKPPKSLVSAFEGIPVANISDNMSRLASMSAVIKPFGRPRLLGIALTVKAPVGDNLMFHKAIDIAEEGDVIVVDGQGDMNHSLCGEIMMRFAKKKGIAGFVIDGCIRDVEGLRELDFPVYARGVTPKGPYKNGPGEINVPVVCGGQAVLPGDILVGDWDGIVVIRAEDAEYVLGKAKDHNAMEQRTFQAIEAGTVDRTWVEKTLREKGCEFR